AIWTGNNRLHVRTTKAGTLKVYTLAGALLKQQEVTEGEISFPLSQGIYIVTFNDGYQQKVVVK
ncbi:MAG: T9SS type A sorting domain-containing protein, partial [Tannerella sp.]|nr:T9SS type A sorting domain-containing protein [Tannerella sp.]